jgi:hypothetical protein
LAALPNSFDDVIGRPSNVAGSEIPVMPSGVEGLPGAAVSMDCGGTPSIVASLITGADFVPES